MKADINILPRLAIFTKSKDTKLEEAHKNIR